VPDAGVEQGRRLVPPSALLRRLLGPALVVAIAGAIWALGRPAGIEPAVLLAAVVVAGTIAGGLIGGLATGAVGMAWAVYYYSQPEWVGAPGNGARVVAMLVGLAAVVWLTALLSDRLDASHAAKRRLDTLTDRLQAFTTVLANEPEDAVSDALVRGTSDLLGADRCVLTVLDPRSGRHFVRAVHGSGVSAVGVEVLPGVGATGQEIRERRLVLTSPLVEPPRGGALRGIRRRLPQPPALSPVAAMPCLQSGRVVATLTVARSDGQSAFDTGDQLALERVAPIVTMAVTGTLLRREQEQGSPRDPTTGLYNRAFLDAALEQLLALRRRSEPAARPALSMILFDIDSFGLLNERHGRQTADQTLRAVATLLRQRFRASDIIARVGPDSFLVVLYGAGAEVAAEAAAQIRRQVRELSLSNARGEPVIVSMSAGCAAVREGERPEALYRSVESALETARWSGPGALVSI
jgi:diguanylate cyclase (GGDEF)-like protein